MNEEALWALVRELMADRDKWKLRSFDRGLLPVRDSLIGDIERLCTCVTLLKQCDSSHFGETKSAGRQTLSFLIQQLSSSLRVLRAELGKLEAELQG